MSQHVKQVARGEGNALYIAVIGNLKAFIGRTHILPLGRKQSLASGQIHVGAAVALGIKNENTAKCLNGFLAGQSHGVHVFAGQLAHKNIVVGVFVRGSRQTKRFCTVEAAQVQALVSNVEFYFVHPKPFFNVLQVLFLNQHARFGQALGQLVVGKGYQGKLVSVKTAHVNAPVALRLHAQAGNGVHGIVVADAKGHLVQNILQKVARPRNGIFSRKGRKILKPLCPAHRQFIGAASLLDEQIARSLIKREVQHARGQLTHKINKGSALNTYKARLGYLSRIPPGKLNVGVSGHDRKTAFFSLEPDGTQILRPGLGGNDGSCLQQALDDLLFVYSKFHMFFPYYYWLL